jgi:hypothetical protein
MSTRRPKGSFDPHQLKTINQAATMAEELVSNHYKMSANEWLRPRYDVKTLIDLNKDEIIEGPFAQIIRYQGQRKDSSLGSGTYDFYKICLQDHTIQEALAKRPDIALTPFSLYIIAHELIHIVRFGKFIQNFDATSDEKIAEEHRVHALTHHILAPLSIPDMAAVLSYYQQWRQPIEGLSDL